MTPPTKLRAQPNASWRGPPVLMRGATLDLPADPLLGSFGAVNGPNGRQVEYKGHPLYTLDQDTGPGQANGEGFEDARYVASVSLAGSSWYFVSDGTPYATAAPTTARERCCGQRCAADKCGMCSVKRGLCWISTVGEGAVRSRLRCPLGRDFTAVASTDKGRECAARATIITSTPRRLPSACPASASGIRHHF